jgi:WD40 repeat protein
MNARFVLPAACALVFALVPIAEADDAVGPIISLTGHTGAVMCIGISPDGRFAATHGGLGDHSLHLWDLSKRRQLSQQANTECEGMSVVWTSDGKSLLSGGAGGSAGGGAVLLQDVRTGKRVGGLLTFERPVRSVALAADGKRFASADGLGVVCIWDFKTGAKLREFKHGAGVNSVAVSSDGQYLLTGSDDKVVRIWSVEKDRQERALESHAATVGCVVFSPDGRRALSASFSPLGDTDNTIRIWDAQSGKELDKLEVGGEGAHAMTAAAFSPDGRRALTGHANGEVRLWDLDAKRKLANFNNHKHLVQSVAFTPDGKYALSGENCQGGSEMWLYRLPGP